MRSSTVVISDWLANCQSGQWTPFEAANALRNLLAKEGYTIVATEALDWLNGEVGSFEKPVAAKGSFWWRSEFRRRAGLPEPYKRS